MGVTRREALRIFATATAGATMAVVQSACSGSGDFANNPQAGETNINPNAQTKGAEAPVVSEQEVDKQLEQIACSMEDKYQYEKNNGGMHFIPTPDSQPFDPSQPFDFGDFSIEDGVQQLSTGNSIYLPIFPARPDMLSTLTSYAQPIETAFTNNYAYYMHYMNHAKESGMSPYDVYKYTRLLNTVYNSAVTEGSYLHRDARTLANGKQVMEAWIFFGKVNGQRLMLILRPDGSPVSAFKPALDKAGNQEYMKAWQYFSRQSPELMGKNKDIPAAIQNIWNGQMSNLNCLKVGMKSTLSAAYSAIERYAHEQQITIQQALSSASPILSGLLAEVMSAPLLIAPLNIFEAPWGEEDTTT